jgi:hypothetical protein
MPCGIAMSFITMQSLTWTCSYNCSKKNKIVILLTNCKTQDIVVEGLTSLKPVLLIPIFFSQQMFVKCRFHLLKYFCKISTKIMIILVRMICTFEKTWIMTYILHVKVHVACNSLWYEAKPFNFVFITPFST